MSQTRTAPADRVAPDTINWFNRREKQWKPITLWHKHDTDWPTLQQLLTKKWHLCYQNNEDKCYLVRRGLTNGGTGLNSRDIIDPKRGAQWLLRSVTHFASLWWTFCPVRITSPLCLPPFDLLAYAPRSALATSIFARDMLTSLSGYQRRDGTNVTVPTWGCCIVATKSKQIAKLESAWARPRISED